MSRASDGPQQRRDPTSGNISGSGRNTDAATATPRPVLHLAQTPTGRTSAPLVASNAVDCPRMFETVVAELRRVAALSPRRFADLDAVLNRLGLQLDRTQRNTLLASLEAENVIDKAIPLDDGGTLVSVVL